MGFIQEQEACYDSLLQQTLETIERQRMTKAQLCNEVKITANAIADPEKMKLPKSKF